MKDLKDPVDEAVGGIILGSDKFIDDIKEKYLKDVAVTRELPGAKALAARHCREEELIEIIDNEKRLTDKEKVKFKLCFLRRYTDKTLNEISSLVRERDISVSAASQAINATEKKCKEDARFAGIFSDIETRIFGSGSTDLGSGLQI